MESLTWRTDRIQVSARRLWASWSLVNSHIVGALGNVHVPNNLRVVMANRTWRGCTKITRASDIENSRVARGRIPNWSWGPFQSLRCLSNWKLLPSTVHVLSGELAVKGVRAGNLRCLKGQAKTSWSQSDIHWYAMPSSHEYFTNTTDDWWTNPQRFRDQILLGIFGNGGALLLIYDNDRTSWLPDSWT